MPRVHRIDAGTLAKPVKRADGTMIVEARLARTGVQTYRNADGSERREYRSESEVFNRASMDSFRLVPVTNSHPPVMLTAQNARQYSVGAVGENIRRDGIWMVAPLAIHDAATIRDMENGKTQVSNGYECDLVMRSGVSPDGEHYDCEQTNIGGNHLAIEHSARAGRDAAARMDAAYAVDDSETRQCRNDGAIMDLAQALAALREAEQKLGKHKERADASDTALEALKKEHTELKARADKLEAERDSHKERADKAEKERTDATNGQTALVDARVDLLSKVTAIVGKTVKMDGADKAVASLSNRSLKLAVIKHVTNADCDKDAAGKPRSDDYIDARYDSAVDQAVASSDTFRGANDLIEHGRLQPSQHGAKRADAAKEYDVMVDANRNGWKKNAGIVNNDQAGK